MNLEASAGPPELPERGHLPACQSSRRFALSQSLDREFYQKNIKGQPRLPGTAIETHFAIGDGRTYDGANMKGFSTADDVAEGGRPRSKSSLRPHARREQ